LHGKASVSERVYGVAKVTGNSRLQSDVLEELSDARHYRRWLADMARPHLGEDPIEIGSGTGDYAIEWLPGVEAFTATEADEDRYKGLVARFSDDEDITVRYLLLGEARDPSDVDEARHSAAVAYNVFEHIPDDVGALRDMSRLVRPGGAVVLLVPAFPSAMSRFDRAIGHQRRYTRASLGAIITGAQLLVEELRYINPAGLLTWYLTVKLLRMTPRNGPLLRFYDRTIVPLARLADRLPTPFGQSLFAVARVPGRLR
jgi:ubiquinone/menaquinone biosynthesis C-methylase UbiE